MIVKNDFLNPFIDMVNSMYDKRVFCMVTLRRKLHAFYKTRLNFSKDVLRLTNRLTGAVFSIKFNFLSDGRILAVLKKGGFLFELFIYSNKNLLEKLIKHGFINDTPVLHKSKPNY